MKGEVVLSVDISQLQPIMVAGGVALAVVALGYVGLRVGFRLWSQWMYKRVPKRISLHDDTKRLSPWDVDGAWHKGGRRQRSS